MGERVERQETGAWVSGVSSRGGALSGREKGCLRLCCRRLCVPPQAGVTASKTPEVGPLAAAEKKVRMLEQQRTEVGGWGGCWGPGRILPHFRGLQHKGPSWPLSLTGLCDELSWWPLNHLPRMRHTALPWVLVS